MPPLLLQPLEDRLAPAAVPFNAAFRAEAAALLKTNLVPQASFAIDRGGEVFTGSVTNADFFTSRNLPVPADPAANALFRVASESKFMTALGIMVLQQQGRLSVNDSVLARLGYTPGQTITGNDPLDPADPNKKAEAALPAYLFDASIAQLLRMTSGLPNSIPSASVIDPTAKLGQARDPAGSYAALAFALRPKDWTTAPGLDPAVRYYLYQTARAKNLGDTTKTPAGDDPEYVVRSPGILYEYNNNNYMLLGKVIEAVSGQTYYDFLKQNVFAPLGIADPFTTSPATADAMIAVGDIDPLRAFPTEVRYYQSQLGTSISPLPAPAADPPAPSAVNVPDPYTQNLFAHESAGGMVATPTAMVKLMKSISDVFEGTGTGPVTRESVLQMVAPPPGKVEGDSPDNYFGFGMVITPDQPYTWNKGGNFPGTLSSLVRLADGTAVSILFNAESPSEAGKKDPDKMPSSLPMAFRALIEKYYFSAASVEVVGGNNQAVLSGAAFTAPLSVIVRDALGDPVAGVAVTFNVPGAGPSGRFALVPATVVTGEDGVAVAPPLTANGLAGAFTVLAGFAGGPAARFELRNLVGRFAVGAGPGAAPQVNVYDAVTNQLTSTFLAFEATFTGGVRVAVADVTGDGVADYVAGAGPGGGPRVRILDGANLAVLADFFAYEPTFTGGVYVAAADLDGDGAAEVVVGAGEGGGPLVRVFAGKTLAQVAEFMAYAPTFRGGVTVAVGDADGDGRFELVVGAGAGGGPQVNVYDAETLGLERSFFAFDAAFTGGVFVAAGGGWIAAGAGSGGGPVVRVFSEASETPATIFALADPGFRGGVSVGVLANGDVLAGTGPGGPPVVRRYAPAGGLPLDEITAFAPGFVGGVWVS